MACVSHEHFLKIRDCSFHEGWSKEYSIHKIGRTPQLWKDLFLVLLIPLHNE